MDTTTILIIVALIVVVLVIAAAVMASRRRRSEELKEKFGPEYDRAVDTYGDTHEAEKKLEERQSRVESLDIHPLTAAERDRYSEQWKMTQAEFVDRPDQAIADADRLVQQVMQQRGYPLGDFEQRAADISVDHPIVVSNYRKAHEIALKQVNGQASTEDLRQAMVHYRALFEDLLQTDSANGRDMSGRNGAQARTEQNTKEQLR